MKTEMNMDQMKKNIANAGGLFYQYRPCRREASTVYDIENIRHGVVYAQTPLYMNDPFDSSIGYSPEKIYDNFISMLMNAIEIENPYVKLIIGELVKHKAVGKVAEFIGHMNEIRKYIYTSQSSSHQINVPITLYVSNNIERLYKRSPKHIKNTYSKNIFLVCAIIGCQIETEIITQNDLNEMFKIDKIVDELYRQVIEIRDALFMPEFKKILSTLTVSCFSSSGWNNQLMWSHYANSYSGICVEYDFNKMNDFIGFVYPINYVSQRPTVTLKDLGIIGIKRGEDTQLEYGETDMEMIFSYLLAKNECWKYEEEWRIINIGEAYTPCFIDTPFIKSITFGMNIDPICKCLLLDLSKEMDIDCYEIVVNTEDYSLDRKLITKENYESQEDIEVEYISLILKQMESMSEHMEELGKKLNGEDGEKDFSVTRPMLTAAVDILSNAYFLKYMLNSICNKAEEDISLIKAPNNILEIVSSVDTFISQIKETEIILRETVPGLHAMGLLSVADYKRVRKQLDEIQLLIEKHKTMEWNPFFISD